VARSIQADHPTSLIATPPQHHMSSEANRIVQKLWSYCTVLRDDGLSYGDYLEQLSVLLSLKLAHEQAQPPWNQRTPPGSVKVHAFQQHAAAHQTVGIDRPAHDLGVTGLFVVLHFIDDLVMELLEIAHQ